jgi:hypothetical protein
MVSPTDHIKWYTGNSAKFLRAIQYNASVAATAAEVIVTGLTNSGAIFADHFARARFILGGNR